MEEGCGECDHLVLTRPTEELCQLSYVRVCVCVCVCVCVTYQVAKSGKAVGVNK